MPSTAIRSTLLKVAAPPRPGLVEALLREQQTLTAVERFARAHDEGTPAQARYYRDLIPARPPGPGQQYAFEVDLDACTGCKACVAACHSLNGLDEHEVWRTVGLLHGGSVEAPAQQTVTTSCHHCVDPACMAGCPVKAYEKDPRTGIVKHLDDQCIGCQYCTLMCPYDAPKYSAARGIVRKCDMCSDRLSAGEAPACVQGCPNGAIKIRVVDQSQAVQASEAGTFLAGAPAPDHTVPTTIYRSARAVPRNMLPADFYATSAEHGHPPLVIMLVLTQLAAGAFATSFALARLGGAPSGGWALVQALVALGLACVALGAATLHLGRPLYAFRALLGLRTSWMSREILAFGVFAKAAALHAVALVPERLPDFPGKALLVQGREPLAALATATGLAGVLCSAMIYVATRRWHWRGGVTVVRFTLTTLLLGIATVHFTSVALAGGLAAGVQRTLLLALLLAGATKLLVDLAPLRHLRERRHTVMRRVALLMVRDLRPVTALRAACGALSVALPALALRGALSGGPALAGVLLALLLAGELAERYLFFKAAPASRMPGALS